MRVLLTSKKRGWSGETAFIEQLARGLLAGGHEVLLGARPDSELRRRLALPDEACIDLDLVHEWSAPRELLQDVRKLREVLPTVDVVHTHASWDTWVTALARSRLRSQPPMVRTRHNLKRIRRHLPNRWLYEKVLSSVVAVSNTVADDLLASGLVPPSRVNTIANGIDPARFDPAQRDRAMERRKLREQLGAPPDAPVVLYLSRLSQRKQPEVLVAAAEQLIRAGSPAWFVLAGSMPARGEWIDALSARIEAGRPRVQRLEFVEDPARLFVASDVMVLPSPDEPFGLVTLEAMAMECPPVCADRGGSAEVVVDGQTGLLFKAGDVDSCAERIQELLGDEPKRRRLAEAGRRDVLARFTAQRMVEEYVRLYRELARRSDRQSREASHR